MFLWRWGGNQGSRERDDAGTLISIGSGEYDTRFEGEEWAMGLT